MAGRLSSTGWAIGGQDPRLVGRGASYSVAVGECGRDDCLLPLLGLPCMAKEACITKGPGALGGFGLIDVQFRTQGGVWSTGTGRAGAGSRAVIRSLERGPVAGVLLTERLGFGLVDMQFVFRDGSTTERAFPDSDADGALRPDVSEV